MIAEDNEMTIKVTCRPTPAAKKTCMQICAKEENETWWERDDRGG